MNVIIVSDHGMADSPQGQKLVDLAKYVPDMQNSALTFLGPVTSIRPLKDTQGKLYSHHMYINVDISNKTFVIIPYFVHRRRRADWLRTVLQRSSHARFQQRGTALSDAFRSNAAYSKSHA